MKIRKCIILAICIAILCVLPDGAFSIEVINSQSEIKKGLQYQFELVVPEDIKVSSYSLDKIRVSWKKIEEADGYYIYRSPKKDGPYKKIHVTIDPNKLWYINTNRTIGKKYYYKIRGYKKEGNVIKCTQLSIPACTYSRPVQSEIKTAFLVPYTDLGKTNEASRRKADQELAVRWKKVPGASGYQLYVRKTGDKVWAWKGEFKTPYANNIALSDSLGSELDLKVRAYRDESGKKVYGLFSKIYSISPDNNEKTEFIQFQQMNKAVASYVANVNYDSEDYTTTQVQKYMSQVTAYSKEEPKGVECIVNSPQIINVEEWDSMRKFSEKTGSGEHMLYNLIPNDFSEFKLNGKKYVVRPTGQVRMIYAPSVFNVRDLGGWNCDGGTVKYGKIIRGGELSGDNSNITEEDIRRLHDQCGIRSEIDLRNNEEAKNSSLSALGSDVEYNRYSLLYYANAVDTPREADKTVAAIKKIFSDVDNGKTVYFHCVSGADRTATISFILLSVLGVSDSDKDKEYELTAFSDETYAARFRNTGYNKKDGNSWYSLVSYFRDNGVGDCMRDKVVNWLISHGISLEEINRFRQNMIHGNPDKLACK